MKNINLESLQRRRLRQRPTLTTDKAPLNLCIRRAKTHEHTFMNIENIKLKNESNFVCLKEIVKKLKM